MIGEEFENLKNCTIFGYAVEELIIFADACKKQGISNDDLKNFCENAKNAYDYIRNEIEEEFKKEISRQLGQRREE